MSGEDLEGSEEPWGVIIKGLSRGVTGRFARQDPHLYEPTFLSSVRKAVWEGQSPLLVLSTEAFALPPPPGCRMHTVWTSHSTAERHRLMDTPKTLLNYLFDKYLLSIYLYAGSGEPGELRSQELSLES